jgi:RHS repeat-associated protein
MLLAKYDASPADSHYYHHDGLGSIMGMTNESGSVEQSYFYDEFGSSLGSWGGVSNHYLYTGQEYDSDVSGAEQYNLRARYYKTGIGRFTSEDPVLQMNSSKGCLSCTPEPSSQMLSIMMQMHKYPTKLNIYIYTINNPLNNTDPTGKGFILVAIGVLAGGMAAIKVCSCVYAIYNLIHLAKEVLKTWPSDDDPELPKKRLLFIMQSDAYKEAIKNCGEFAVKSALDIFDPFTLREIP